MAEFNPSPEWTDEEREKVILENAKKMQEGANMSLIQPTRELYCRDQRINFSRTKDSHFLEIKRNTILNGFPGSATTEV